MTKDTIEILVVMIVYMALVIGIGLYFSKRAQSSAEQYFLGGRTLGPWITAMSAEASDMSGYLLMGLPGLAYWCGLADAAWTAIGLAVGTCLNWIITSRRLRNYTIVAGNAITLPDFLSNRFHEKKKVIMGIASVLILVFFTVYASSCFVTCGKLFSGIFGASYVSMMLVGAVFVLAYTLIGGFLAESASDFMQSIVMIFALVLVLCFGINYAGGFKQVFENIKSIDGFFSLTSLSTPVEGVANEFGKASDYTFLNIISMLAWGLGYFGMPQVLLRFMAIRKSGELKRSTIIASVWVVISLAAAVFIGLIGRAAALSSGEASLILTNGSAAESIFANLSKLMFHPIVAGIVMAGILAATISSSDSYLLIAASSVSQNIFKGIFKKDATDKQVMWLSRIVLAVITIVGALIALDENSIIFQVVSFAWAGFGATFGPLVIFSLFWKRTTREGAIAGMLSGATMVFVWKLILKPIGGVFGIYELLPAFIVSCIFIVVVSLLTKAPDKSIIEEFERAKNYQDGDMISID